MTMVIPWAEERGGYNDDADDDNDVNDKDDNRHDNDDDDNDDDDLCRFEVGVDQLISQTVSSFFHFH